MGDKAKEIVINQFFLLYFTLSDSCKFLKFIFRNKERYATIVHPTAIIRRQAILDPGVCVLANAYVAGVHLKFGTMVMIGVIISHDAEIGPLAYLSTGCLVGSSAKIGRSSSVSLSASVIEENNVGDFAVVAAGALVNCDVPEGSIYAGVPAKFIRMIKD